MPKRRNTKRAGRRSRRSRNNQLMFPAIPRGPLDTARTVFRYPFTLSSNGSGVISNVNIIGTDVVGLTDFADFAAIFSQFTILRTTLHISVIHQNTTEVIQSLAVGFSNDQVLTAPTSITTVLAHKGAKYFNPQVSASQGSKISANPKPTQSPWTPTAGQTTSEDYQFGGWLFYSSSNAVSAGLWCGYFTAEVAFIGRS